MVRSDKQKAPPTQCFSYFPGKDYDINPLSFACFMALANPSLLMVFMPFG
jgi:hypothetical protein